MHLWTQLRFISLSSMTSQVSFAVWTTVMNVHAFVDAARNQATTQPTSQQCYDDPWNISDHTRFSLCRCIDLSMAMRANRMGRPRPKRNNSCNYGRPVRIGLRRCIRAGRWNTSYSLRISRWCIWRRFVRRRWSVLMHGVSISTLDDCPWCFNGRNLRNGRTKL